MDRITRKQLKTDKFAVEVEHTVEYVAEHKKQVTVYASVALVIVILAGGIWFYRKHQRAERQTALSAALEVEAAPVGPPNPQSPAERTYLTAEAKHQAAMKEFSSVAARYAGTDEGVIATSYLAGIHADEGRLAEAEKYFKQVVAEGNKDFASLGNFSLAQIYFATGRAAEGEKILRALVDNPSVLVSKEQAQIALARAIALTKPAEARKLLEPLRTLDRPAVSQSAITALSEVPNK